MLLWQNGGDIFRLFVCVVHTTIVAIIIYIKHKRKSEGHAITIILCCAFVIYHIAIRYEKDALHLPPSTSGTAA